MPPPASNDTGTALTQDGSDWSRDLVTVTVDIGGHGACGWCGSSSSIRVPRLKFVDHTVRKIWCTMCVSINGPCDLDLWPFDLKTGTRVASQVGNLHSEFGHAWFPSYSLCTRRTDGQTKATLTVPFTGGDITSVARLWAWRVSHCCYHKFFAEICCGARFFCEARCEVFFGSQHHSIIWTRTWI